MSIPFGYVSPEQVLKDKADYARKGIDRGRALVAATYADGVVLCAENSSTTLHKVSEIYDRIAFAGVGKFSEFDSLRTAGVRLADVKGFTYSREDVDARSLANAYAQSLGQVFTHEMKPMEVEILVAEVGTDRESDQLFRISYEGTIVDEDGSTVLGGDADTVGERLRANLTDDLDLGGALRAAVSSLAGPERVLEAENLEVAVLARTTARRAFRRVLEAELTPLLSST